MRGASGFLLVVGLITGCAPPNSTACGDGSFCPEGFRCDLEYDGERDRCVTEEQQVACVGLAEGDRCFVDDRGARCQFGACLPACGDGVLDAGEQCDDSNDTSHDGCSSGCLAETQSWVEWDSPWRPRSGHAIAYDSDRDRVVIFGGYDDGPLGDTLERIINGRSTTWKLAAAVGPSPRTNVAMAYDPVRKRIVLFGGQADSVLDDTWEFDGSTWKQQDLPIRPPARHEHAMVFDATRGKVVLFGGIGASSELGDTWTYDGAWTEVLAQGDLPGPRSSVAIGYEPTRGAVVIFGSSFVSPASETYELTDRVWSKVGGPQPPRRRGAAMAYWSSSPGTGVLLLHGGADENAVLRDAWTYAGSQWSPATFDPAPPPTYDHALVSVPDRNLNDRRLVLVGGRSGSERFASTWDLGPAASAWSERSSPVSPLASVAPAATDGAGHMTIFGQDGVLWQFDGRTWSSAPTEGGAPSNRYAFAFDYVPTRDAHVMFGGGDSFASNGNAPFSETWELEGGEARLLGLTPPPACALCAAAYDATRQVLVLVGSSDATWELGSTWTQGPDLPAGAQRSAALAYDPRQGAVILLANDGSTWRYDGAWTNLGIPAIDSGRTGAALAYDRLHGELVLFGGSDTAQNYSTTTHRLTAAGWEPLPVSGEPPPGRRYHSLAFVRGQGLVMFGGATSTDQQRGDTWLLQSTSATPDEECTDGVDNDGDTRVDAADPDC